MQDLDCFEVDDSTRIKNNTLLCRQMSLIEAFEAVYKTPINLSEEDKKIAEDTPPDIKVGSIIELGIESISASGVVFNTLNNKHQFITRNNLWKYDKFKYIATFPGTVRCRVIEKQKDKIIVDIVGLMTEEFITPRIKNPKIQHVTNTTPEYIKVTDLKLINGGYSGKAIIPSTTQFCGEAYTVPAFIPGSHIVLNTEKDFESWEGKSVDTFIVSESVDTRTNEKILVCSRKDVLVHDGELNIISLYKHWCDDDAVWKEESEKKRVGIVTGVIHSKNKCGVFIEIPTLNITGMMNCASTDLVNYKSGDEISVKISSFEVPKKWDSYTRQLKTILPYDIKKEDDLEYVSSCNIKAVLDDL